MEKRKKGRKERRKKKEKRGKKEVKIMNYRIQLLQTKKKRSRMV